MVGAITSAANKFMVFLEVAYKFLAVHSKQNGGQNAPAGWL